MHLFEKMQCFYIVMENFNASVYHCVMKINMRFCTMVAEIWQKPFEKTEGVKVGA